MCDVRVSRAFVGGHLGRGRVRAKLVPATSLPCHFLVQRTLLTYSAVQINVVVVVV